MFEIVATCPFRCPLFSFSISPRSFSLAPPTKYTHTHTFVELTLHLLLLSLTRRGTPRKMRSTLVSLCLAALLASTCVFAHAPKGGNHLKMKRQALRNKRSWSVHSYDLSPRRPKADLPCALNVLNLRGRRDGTPVVSDTGAAAAGATASASGVIVQPVAPIGCSASVGFGGSCDQASGVCWLVTNPVFPFSTSAKRNGRPKSRKRSSSF